MCLEIITHRMIHDKRTMVQLDDGEDAGDAPRHGTGDLVTPYAEPLECRCGNRRDDNPGRLLCVASPIRPAMQCGWHDCCRTCRRVLPCREQTPGSPPLCPEEERVAYHKYEPRDEFPNLPIFFWYYANAGINVEPPNSASSSSLELGLGSDAGSGSSSSSSSSLGFSHEYGQLPDDRSPVTDPAAEGWHPLPVADAYLGHRATSLRPPAVVAAAVRARLDLTAAMARHHDAAARMHRTFAALGRAAQAYRCDPAARAAYKAALEAYQAAEAALGKVEDEVALFGERVLQQEEVGDEFIRRVEADFSSWDSGA